MMHSLLARYRRLRKLYEILFLPLQEQYGLTRVEIDILLFLANNPEFDTARDMAEIRRIAKSHISAGVDALANRGLLERFHISGNRKVIHLRPTREATVIIERGQDIQRRYSKVLFDGFSQEDREAFLLFLDRISENVEAALASEKERN